MSIMIYWAENPSEDNVTAYIIYRADSYSGTYAELAIVTGNPPPTHYEDATGTSTNWYRVAARNAYGDGPKSPPLPASYSSTFCTLREGEGWLSDFGKGHIDERDLREAEATATIRVMEDLIANWTTDTVVDWLEDPPLTVRTLAQCWAALRIFRKYRPSDSDMIEQLEQSYERDLGALIEHPAIITSSYSLHRAIQDVDYPSYVGHGPEWFR